MADLLGIGSSALLAYRSALNVVGQNVSNANTAGYSRQRIDLQANAPTAGTVGIGTGVSVNSIQRLSDRFTFNRLVSQDSSLGRLNTISAMSDQLDGWLSGSSTGLSQPMQKFFDSLNALSGSASSTAARQVALQSASALAGRFNDLQRNLDQAASEVDGRLVESAQQISVLATQIATLNERIVDASGASTTQQPNELIDQRDQMLRQLATQVGITTTSTADGAINVSLGSGQALVLGSRASSLSVGADAWGRPRDLVLNTGASSVSVTQQVSGGVLGGLVDYRRDVLEPAASQLGGIASALAGAINEQHAKGMDQYGELGGDLFAEPTPSLRPAIGNAGSASINATISDASALTGKDYVLRYDGLAWQLSNASSGAAVPLAGSGTPADPFTAEGLSLVIGSGAAAGDRFLVQPTARAAAQLSVAISDPARLAASNPLRTASGGSNIGSAKLATPQVLNAGDANLLQTVNITFIAPNQYSINGSGSYAYTDGGNIDINGWRVQISGVPATGDSFTLSSNDGTSGDNSNAVALSAIANQGVLAGGRNTLSSANTALVSGVGAQSASASVQLDAQTALRTQSQAERDAVSGVNLDEEAADLIRFQQAYQAAAQVMSAANTLFDSLLSAIRR